MPSKINEKKLHDTYYAALAVLMAIRDSAEATAQYHNNRDHNSKQDQKFIDSLLAIETSCTKLKNELFDTDLYFSAVTTKIEKFKDVTSSNVHRLVRSIAHKIIWKLRNAILDGSEISFPNRKFLLENAKLLASEYILLLGGFLVDIIRGSDSLNERLRQELARALMYFCDRMYPPSHNKRIEIKNKSHAALEEEYELTLLDGYLSDAENKIVSAIRKGGHRMNTAAVLSTLEKEYGAASEGTTKVNLATLVRRKILTNRQDVTPKGYGLPEWD